MSSGSDIAGMEDDSGKGKSAEGKIGLFLFFLGI